MLVNGLNVLGSEINPERQFAIWHTLRGHFSCSSPSLWPRWWCGPQPAGHDEPTPAQLWATSATLALNWAGVGLSSLSWERGRSWTDGIIRDARPNMVSNDRHRTNANFLSSYNISHHQSLLCCLPCRMWVVSSWCAQLNINMLFQLQCGYLLNNNFIDLQRSYYSVCQVANRLFIYLQ